MAELRRFFTERHNLRMGSSVKILDSEAKHIKGSLRLSKGDQIILFNGQSQFVAKLTLVTKDVVMAEIIDTLDDESEDHSQPLTKITLYQSLIKLPQMELVLQKATELGVDKIVPIQTEFSQIKIHNPEKRFSRWQKIILQAVKQSERDTIPELSKLEETSMEDLLDQESDSVKLFMTSPRTTTEELGNVAELSTLSAELNEKNIAIFIGPEGGFSPTEHKLAVSKGIDFVYFNQNILRSETAAISAIAIIRALTN